MSKKILMACIHYWNSPYQVATHHLARQFDAAGWEVLYLSAPMTPLHLFKLGDPTVRERARLALKKPLRKNIGGGSVTSVIPLALLGPDNRPPLNTRHIIEHWPSYSLGSISRSIRRLGFSEVDVMYLDNFYSTPLRQLVNANKTVYHMADNYSAFPGYSRAFLQAEKHLVSQVDDVYYPSRDMTGYVKNLRPKLMHFLPNGVDSRWFNSGDVELPAEYHEIPQPRAVYVGAIEAWFDFELVAEAARAHSNISFVLIGQDALARKNLPALANVHILGRRSRDQLPAYLRHAQAGIIPFNVAAFPELLHPVRPLKLLEYLAAGIPCLSVGWRELETMDAPVTLAYSKQDFIEALPAVCAESGGERKRQEYARKFDWDTIFNEFCKQLG